MYKAAIAHYKNKYPKGKIFADETHLDVWDEDGNHAVSLRKDSFGRWVCRSSQHGCLDRHDLAPIPKDSRAWKLYIDGEIRPSEEYDERIKVGQELADDTTYSRKGKVPSIADIIPDNQDSHWCYGLYREGLGNKKRKKIDLVG